MPIRNRLRKTPHPAAPELTCRLVAEWKDPRENGQPLIVQEGGNGIPTHIYVIWDDWSELNQTERSEIIMDACEEIYGVQESLQVTVALGLTKPEAERMRISVD